MSAIYYTWDGEAMRPWPRFAKQCDQHFVVGESYYLEAVERDWIKLEPFRRMYFASVHEAWKNLPESARRFGDDSALRYWCLIKCGFADESNVVCDTEAEAVRWTNYQERANPNVVIVRKGNVVTTYTAMSQKRRAMTPETFRASAEAVLDLLADMIGTSVSTLKKNAARAA